MTKKRGRPWPSPEQLALQGRIITEMETHGLMTQALIAALLKIDLQPTEDGVLNPTQLLLSDALNQLGMNGMISTAYCETTESYYYYLTKDRNQLIKEGKLEIRVIWVDQENRVVLVLATINE